PGPASASSSAPSSPLSSSAPTTTEPSTSTSAPARRWSGDAVGEARCRRDRCVRRGGDGGPRDPRGRLMSAEGSRDPDGRLWVIEGGGGAWHVRGVGAPIKRYSAKKAAR